MIPILIYFWTAPFVRISKYPNLGSPNIALWPSEGPMNRLLFLIKILLSLLWATCRFGQRERASGSDSHTCNKTKRHVWRNPLALMCEFTSTSIESQFVLYHVVIFGPYIQTHKSFLNYLSEINEVNEQEQTIKSFEINFRQFSKMFDSLGNLY